MCQTGAWFSLGFRLRRHPGGSSLTSGQHGGCRSACGENKATARGQRECVVFVAESQMDFCLNANFVV
jgi:hypothetical protein